jgi:hypothetical protein
VKQLPTQTNVSASSGAKQSINQASPASSTTANDCSTHNGGQGDGYSWTQTLDDVSLSIQVPPTVIQVKNVKCEIKRDRISVYVDTPAVSAKPQADVYKPGATEQRQAKRSERIAGQVQDGRSCEAPDVTRDVRVERHVLLQGSFPQGESVQVDDSFWSFERATSMLTISLEKARKTWWPCVVQVSQ